MGDARKCDRWDDEKVFLQVAGHLLETDLPVHRTLEQNEKEQALLGSRHPPRRPVGGRPTHMSKDEMTISECWVR